MGVSIKLEFGDGDFEHGFNQNQFLVTITTLDSKNTQIKTQLCPSPEIPKLYQDWKQQYHSLLERMHQRGFKNKPNSVSSQDCAKQAKALRRQLHEWLEPVNLELEPILQQYADAEIHLVIHTEKVTSLTTKDTLHRLPWQEWDIFLTNISFGNNTRKNYTGEAALCFKSNQSKGQNIVESNSGKIRRVRIISIFGDSQGIDTNADKDLISKLKKQGAELINLLEPSRDDFVKLWEEPNDILFFAGHSETQSDGTAGVIHINRDEKLSLDEITKTLSAAIANGLKLAIFNSCDGLGLATQLADLNLPYIIVWREVVPDVVAQKFIRYFLSSFASGKSLFASVESARVQLCELANLEKQLPGVTWLPIIICQDTIAPPLWSDLGGLTGELPDNPYRGLSAFREEDAAFYFGRENFIADLVKAVDSMPLVPVIGASGSGKSSVVFAGLVPRLREKGDVGIVSFRPENKPFDNLAIALTSPPTPLLQGEGRLAQIGIDLDWRHDETKLCDYIQTLISASGHRRLVLIADQFEELYTLTPETERCSFLKALYFAIKYTPNFTLVLTLRADFLGIVLNSLLSKALQEYAPLLLAPMSTQELRDAIEKPAAKMKVELSPGLTNKLINDLGNHPGRLPLLEFALMQLWEKQDNWFLTHQAYEEIGGLEKALAKHADSILDELQLEDLENRYSSERIFIQLVSPGAGTEDTRRVATHEEVGSQNWDLVQKLADKRLVVTGRDETNGIETVEIVHEALIREWETFRKWIENNREFRTWQERLKQDARVWEQNQKNLGSLLHGTPLSVAEDWYKQRQDELTEQQQNYITASIRRRNQEQQQQKLKRNLTILGLVSGLAIVSFFAGNSEIRRTDSEAARLSFSSEKNFNQNNSETAVIDALKAGKLVKNSIWKPWIAAQTQMQTVSNLQEVIYNFKARTLKGHAGEIASVIFSPDGKTVASASVDQTVKLWDATNGTLTKTLIGHTDIVRNVIFSPDGKTVASASDDKTVKLWDATNGTLIKTLIEHTDEFYSVILFSPDGKTVASASWDNTVKLWDATNGTLIKTLTGHTDLVNSVIFSPDGKTVASASDDKTVKLWDATNGTLIKTLAGHTSTVYSVIFSPNGKTVASASDDKTVKLWDATNGTLIKTLTGHTNIVRSVIFSPDGKTVASASNDKTVKLWDATNGTLIKTLAGHTDIVRSVIFSPNGKTVASASDDKTVKLWDATNGTLIKTLTGHTNIVRSVIFSPDGKTVASASDDKTVKLWDATNGTLIKTLAGHTDIVYSVIFSPNGKTVASASDDKTVKLWDATNGTLIKTLAGHTSTVYSVIFSPNGKTVASASGDKTVKLWDATNGTLVETLTGHTDLINSVIFSPDGKTVASASWDNTVKLWDARNGTLIKTLTGHTAKVRSVIFSRDGKTVASASDDKTVKLWDATNGTLIKTLTGHTDEVNSVIFSPDGKTVASASNDKTVKLWDATNGTLIKTLAGHTDIVYSVIFSPNGKTVASASDDKTVKLWDATNGTLIKTLAGHTDIVYSVIFSPNGKTVASASDDKTVKLWDATNGTLIKTLTGHTGAVGSVIFSPDGKTVASASSDKTVKLWDATNGTLIKTLGHTNAVYSVIFSPDGKTVASASYDNTVILWNLDLDNLLVRGCKLIRGYLKDSPDVNQEDRNLCDGI